MAKKDTAVARETSPSAETSLQIQTAPADAKRVTHAEGGAAVWMPPERAPGVRAFGAMVPGTVYVVTPAEALRLVTVKGFRFADAAAQRAVSDHVDGIADAATTTPQE